MAATAQDWCDCTTCGTVRLNIKNIFRILDLYGWFLDAYVVDFFHDDIWEKLPQCWRIVLQDVSPTELGNWVSREGSCKRVWPLSLIALRQAIDALQINRDFKTSTQQLRCMGRLISQQKFVDKSHIPNEINDNNNLSYLDNNSNSFSKRIKLKKRHEIKHISQECATCATQSGTKRIIDIGAGMGHLARVLAFQFGLEVTCIEQNHSLSKEAEKCDNELLMAIKRQSPDFAQSSPKHISARLDSNSHKKMKLESLNQMEKTDVTSIGLEDGFGIVGLHPCGDLAPTLLNIYVSEKNARYICIVGCCYMKLTLQPNNNTFTGYPLSNYMFNLKNYELSYSALEVACHAIEKYCKKLKTGDYQDLIVHAYRAALETILIKKDKSLRRTQLKNVKVKDNMSFEEYCQKTTSVLSEHLRPNQLDYNDPRIVKYLQRWRQVVIFGSLRLLLAPLIETLVLLDRFLFLSERKLNPTLKPIFDSNISPRNFVLTSVKNCCL